MENKYSLDEILKRIRQNWPEMISPESEAVLSFLRLNDIIEEDANKTIAMHGLTPISFEVLITLRGSPVPHQLSPTELYRSALCTSGGMTKALKALEDDGYVERISHESDRRSKLVRLSKSGELKATEVMTAVTQGDRNLFAGKLSSEDVRQLRDVLLPFIRKIEAD